MFEKLYEYIFFIATFLYLLFAFFLFSHKKGNRLSHILFAVFCLSNMFVIIDDLLSIFRISVYETLPVYLSVITASSFFLTGPLLYFYTKSMTQKNLAFRKIYLLHLVPFLIDIAYRNFRFFTQPNVRDIILEQGYFINYSELLSRYILRDVHMLAYIAASLVILYKYRSELKELFSSVEKMKLSWLSWILYGFLAVQLFSLSKHALSPLNEVLKDILGIFMHSGTLFLATVIVFRGLKQPDIFLEIEEKRPNQKYVKTKLPPKIMTQYLEKLARYMEEKKPYLNTSLNINELAELLSMPSHHLSQILNGGLKQNFYQFINKYRIEEFKRIMAKQSNHNKTVLEVLYEAGFESKSTFNRIFKQQTGITPTQFIRSQKEN